MAEFGAALRPRPSRARVAPPERGRRRGRDTRVVRMCWLVGGVLASLFVGDVVMRDMFVIVTVRNQSMSPTLEAGDRVLVLRHWPPHRLRKGLVVIVWPWERGAVTRSAPFGVETLFIKRIVGVPGETLVTSLAELDDHNRAREVDAHDQEGHRVWRVPSGQVFVRGDHPIGGFDSLSWGPIPAEKVLGVVIMKLRRTTVSDVS